jgi:mono/diheme cytochrome c family protein
MSWTITLAGTCIVSLACNERPDRAAPATAGVMMPGRGDTGARARGRQIFLSRCVSCHGARADGAGVEALGLLRPPPSFADPSFREPGARMRVESALRDGVPGSTMPAWRHLGPDALRDLTEYVLSVPEQGP